MYFHLVDNSLPGKRFTIQVKDLPSKNSTSALFIEGIICCDNFLERNRSCNWVQSSVSLSPTRGYVMRTDQIKIVLRSQ